MKLTKPAQTYFGMSAEKAVEALSGLCAKYAPQENIDVLELINGFSENGGISSDGFKAYMYELVDTLYERRRDAHSDYQIDRHIHDKTASKLRAMDPDRLTTPKLQNDYKDAILTRAQKQKTMLASQQTLQELENDALGFESAILSLPERLQDAGLEILKDASKGYPWPPDDMARERKYTQYPQAGNE